MEADSCPICLGVLTPGALDVTRLPCTHMMHSSCAVNLFRHGISACPLCRDLGEAAERTASSSVSTTTGGDTTDSEVDFEDAVSMEVAYAPIPSLKRLVAPILRVETFHRMPPSVRTVIKRCKKHREEMQAARRATREFEAKHRQQVKQLNALRRAQLTRENRFRKSAKDALLA